MKWISMFAVLRELSHFNEMKPSYHRHPYNAWSSHTETTGISCNYHDGRARLYSFLKNALHLKVQWKWNFIVNLFLIQNIEQLVIFFINFETKI